MVRPTLLLAALIAPPTAQAGGYYYTDSGIVPFARGGAWFASADSQYAQRYNPAGLVRVERPELSIGLTGVQQDITFTRLDEEGFQEPAPNLGKPFTIPELGFAMPLPHGLAFAFGFTSPFAPDYRFDPDGPQRYSSIDATVWTFQVGPSIAWRPLHWLAVGASLQWHALRVGTTVKVTTSGSTDPSGDVQVQMDSVDFFSPGANLGLLVEPIPELSIGLLVQPPVAFRAKGYGELDFSEWGARSVLDQEQYRDDEVFVSTTLPIVLGLGVAVRPIPRLEVEIAATYERWSTLEEILVEGIDVSVSGSAIGELEVPESIALPAGFRDVYSVRLGGEVEITDAIVARAGGFWERGSLSTQEISPALYDPSKFQASLGGGFLIADHFRIDTSFAYLFIQNLEVRDSEVTQINVFSDREAVVGNGDYTSSGWMAGLRLSYVFGKRPAAPPEPAFPREQPERS